MNNNLRGIRSTSDKQSYKNSGIGTRHSSISTPNNNIHININLNVKKKSQCIIHQGNPTGKKINNFVEVSDPKNQHQGSGITDQHQKHSQQLMKSTAVGKAKFLTTNKKSQADKKMQKTKKKKIKQKEKTASKPYTPQKHQKGQSEEKSFQRSKTGKKLAKKKQSKSMQNLKVFKQKHILDNRKVFDLTNNHKDNYKFKSKSNSSSKQRSRQKSATKLKKNRSSSKNIVAFQNSGIKKVLINQRQAINKSEGLQHLRKSKKSLKPNKTTEKDIIKIHEFMQEKKKNDDKNKKLGQHLTKGIKIKDQLIRASRQKKQFFSRPQNKQTPYGVSKNSTKFPIYFGQEDENNEQVQNSSVFRIQRNTSHSNYHKTPQKPRIHSKSAKMSPQIQKISASNNKKHVRQSLLQKYMNARLTSVQYEKFISKIIKIQSNWRGYYTRRILLQQISKMNRLTVQKKRLINEKKSEFWDDDDNNSITNVQYQPKEQAYNKQKQSKSIQQTNQPQPQFTGSGFSFRTPQGSNYNSSSTPTEEIHTNNKKYQSQSGNQLQYQHEGRINIDDFKKNIAVLQKQKQAYKNKRSTEKVPISSVKQKQHHINNDDSISNNNSFLVNQIQQLRKLLQQQNKKFSKLQKQNTQLKENLMSVIIEKKKDNLITINKKDQQKSKQHNHDSYDDQLDDVEIYDIKMMKEVQTKKSSSNSTVNNKFKNLTIETEDRVQKPLIKQQKVTQTKNNINSNASSTTTKSPSSSLYVQHLKKQLSSFQSPSNRQLKSAQISGIKNLQRAFKKKQLSIQLTYEKNSTIYQQMLQNNIVSPRTYNFKKIELDEKYKRQKQQISSKFKQAQKVIKYISQEIVQQEKAGEDESPKKRQYFGDNVNEKNPQIKVQHTTKITQAISLNVSEQQHSHSHNGQQHYQSHVINKHTIIQHSPQIQVYNESSSLQSNFRKYWTDDIDEVHKKVLEISQKIDQALGEEDNEEGNNQQNGNNVNNNKNSNDDDLKLQSNELRSQQMRQYSSQLRQYSSQNSNFSSNYQSSSSNNNSNNNQQQDLQQQNNNQNNNQRQSTLLYEQNQYTIINNNTLQQPNQQQVMPNTSATHSDKSGRSLQSYNIHYPSSPSNSQKQRQSNIKHTQQQKHTYQVKNEIYYDQQNSLQNNNSQLSSSQNNKSSLSQQQQNSILSQSTLTNKQKQQPKGFDTRLTFIKQYCIALCEFIRSQHQLKQKFIENISTPLRYNYLQYLKSYRTTLTLQYDNKYNSTKQQYFYPYFKLSTGSITTKALTITTTDQFDELYNNSYGISSQLTEQMLLERKYFIQAIVDVFNQSLDFQRPGSVYGEQLPWLVMVKNLKNNHVKFLAQPENMNNNVLKSRIKNNNPSDEQQNQQQQQEQDQRLDKIFGIAIAKIIQWGSCLCGFIPQPVSFDGQQAQAVNIDQEQTNLVRQTRLAYMLEKSLMEDQQKMVDHTMEQLEVQLEMQQIIFRQLVEECVGQINKMGSNSNKVQVR